MTVHRVSRTDLHRRVWDKPLTDLAKEFGATATGLAKICDRQGIPRPPQGHWTRQAHGKAFEVTPLPEPKDGQSENFDILLPRRKPKPTPKEKQAAKQTAEILGSANALDDFKNLHPAVKRWVNKHKADQAKQREKRRNRRSNEIWGSFYAPIPKLTERDRYRFQATSTIFKAIEKAGAKIADAKITGGFNIKIGQHILDCTIKEKMRQGLSKVDRSWSAYPDHHQGGLHSSGFLRLSVNTHIDGSKLEWVEKSDKLMVDLLSTIVPSLMACGPKLDVKKAEHEAWQRQYEEEQKQRYEEQQRRELDERRWKHLRAQAAAWEECQRLRQFIDALETRMLDDAPDEVDGLPANDWLKWCKQKLAEMDPMERTVQEILIPPSRW